MVAFTSMKMKFFASVAGFALVAFVIGCVNTVNGRKTAAMPFVNDRLQGRYERSVDEVFTAAKEVVKFNGTLSDESTLYTSTNAVRVLEGRVNEKKVWVRVEEVDPKVSCVTVQVRGKAGGKDINLTAELEKQIALKLVR